MTEPVNEFIRSFSASFESSDLVKLTFSKPKDKSSDLRNVIISPVLLKDGMVIQMVFRYATRDVTHNFSLDKSIIEISRLIASGFLNADMYVTGRNIRLLSDKKGSYRLLQQKVDLPAPVDFSHNRTKIRLLEPHGNVWMFETGITNAEGEIRNALRDKYVQINRYLEVLKPELETLPTKKPLIVADMGSGKGYLTFALYDYLINSMEKECVVTGVEYRADLVSLCNSIAQKSVFGNLKFMQGTIEDSNVGTTDVLIALHACDTATDDAIYKGITAGAELIVCAPCCHKQVRKEMKTVGILSSILRHGILQERQAELLTDGIRALIMEWYGYKTRVFEFISPEHTSKNIMIIGRKGTINRERQGKIKEEIVAIKDIYGISGHYLEQLTGI